MPPDIPSREPHVAASIARLVLDLSGAEQGEVLRWCEAVGLDPADLERADARLPRTRLVQLVALVEQQVADPALAFGAYERINPGLFQTVGFAMMASGTLLQALARLVRFASLLDSSLHIQLHAEGSHYRLQIESVDGPPVPCFLATAGLAALLGFLRFIAGGHPVRVIELASVQAPPVDLEGYRRLLGEARLKFDAPYDSLLFAGDDLTRALSPVSPQVDEVTVGVTEHKLEALRCKSLVSLQVRQLLTERMSDNVPTIDEIAADLHMTRRSLQRALAREGVQFKELLDKTRRQLAHVYLRHTAHTLKAVAYLLGFREPSSFHRACVRWFGATPLQYRADKTARG